jgi:ACR3 family arsenite efflux pump ArsB
MKDITSPGWIKAKGILFLIVGIVASTLLLIKHPTWEVALLLALTIWYFCRSYFFAFYVIERYVDPSYKSSGLCSFANYLIR